MATILIISASSIIRTDTDLRRLEDFVEEGSMERSPAGAAASSHVRRLTQEGEVIAIKTSDAICTVERNVRN
jgi:proline racemase